jgi:hypothetical protein
MSTPLKAPAQPAVPYPPALFDHWVRYQEALLQWRLKRARLELERDRLTPPEVAR